MIPAFLQKMNCRYLAEEDVKRTGNGCLAVLEAKDLLPAAKAFLAADWHLEDVSGLMASEGAVAAYHFDHFETPSRVTLLVIAPYDDAGSASFPSIAGVYQGAEWHERETRDFYGFAFIGNPNFVPLLLPDDMSEVHPLYKDEAARAPLAKLFAAPEGSRSVIRKVDGFSLLDAPPKEEPTQAAPVAPTQPAAAPVVPAAKPAPEKQAEPQPKAEAAPGQAKAAPKPAAESKPAPAKKEASPAVQAKPAAKPAEKAPAKPAAKPAPKPAAKKPEKSPAKPAPAVKTPVKKGGGNA